MIDGGIDEGADEWRGRVRRGLELRLEECRDEERVARKLRDAHVAMVVFADELQARALQRRTILGVDAIAAVVPLDDAPSPIDGGGAARRIEKDWRCLADERAGERRDHWPYGCRIGFRVIGVR